MADNVAITAGAGTTIATDDNGTAHHQVVKLMLGANSTFTGQVGGEQRDAAPYAMYVDNRPSSASQAQSSAGLTTASTSYSIGDTLGTGWTFTSMARASGGRGRITSVNVVDKADIMTSITLYLSSASITFGTDNSAPSISDADALNLVGSVAVGLTDLGGCRYGSVSGVAIPYACAATSLYVYATTATAHTFFGATSDIVITLIYELD